MTRREEEILRWIREDPLISQQELADRAGITRSSMGVHISNLMRKGLIAGRGYVLAGGEYVAVVGGVNMDVGGVAHRALIPGDSNPGRVRMSLGGVGRNIAHNLALLGEDVRMITALGDDLYARRITASCAELGIDLSRALRVPGAATSTYLYLAGPEGEMNTAVSDMEIYDHLTPAYLERCRSLTDNARALVLDTNLPAETVVSLAERCKTDVFADPVSAAKAEKLRPVLGKLHTLKPNRLEAELLSGVPITDERSLHAAADALLSAGVKRVFLSLGAEGVLAADGSGRLRLGVIPAEHVVNTTGCGDAFMAALVWAHRRGADLAGAARAGRAAASITAESAETIHPGMSEPLLLSRMEKDNI